MVTSFPSNVNDEKLKLVIKSGLVDVAGIEKLPSEPGEEPTTVTAPEHPSTPESSQTESDDVSPQVQRKRRLHTREGLPRFSISTEDDQPATRLV